MAFEWQKSSNILTKDLLLPPAGWKLFQKTSEKLRLCCAYLSFFLGESELATSGVLVPWSLERTGVIHRPRCGQHEIFPSKSWHKSLKSCITSVRSILMGSFRIGPIGDMEMTWALIQAVGGCWNIINKHHVLIQVYLTWWWFSKGSVPPKCTEKMTSGLGSIAILKSCPDQYISVFFVWMGLP